MTKERGSTALVTGGSFGLGLAMARHLIAEGFHVIACGRSLERLKSAGESLPGLHTVRADVTRADDLERLFEEVLAPSRPLDMLVNNERGIQTLDTLINLIELHQAKAAETFWQTHLDNMRTYALQQGAADRPIHPSRSVGG
jgi:short-subunit dehydrogenase involved in D-alanine esterification of teichoic acids